MAKCGELKVNYNYIFSANNRNPELANKRRIKSEIINIHISQGKPIVCAYCYTRLTPANLTLDHVIPKFNGGLTLKSNSNLACYDCNQAKDSLSDAKFKSLIKGPIPKGNFNQMRAWSRRKLSVYTNRSCVNLEKLFIGGNNE